MLKRLSLDLVISIFLGSFTIAADVPRLNLLLITADDMNYDTPGATGNRLPDVTPNIDRLASQGLRFVHAHVTVAVCQPSRECLMTGRYPHRNGAIGFYPVRPEVPTLQEQLKKAGYLLGILGKVQHLRPAEKFPWDFQHDAGELGAGRNPDRYYRYVKEFLAQAKSAGKPFFLMANSHDPHRPWAGSADEGRKGAPAKLKAQADSGEGNTLAGGYPSPSRIYQPREITVHGFLADLPDVRTEVAQYYSSAHRCDQTVGEVLRALAESGLEGQTLVVFLSDNGISMPFAKSNCYLTSTRTPLIVRWPGKVKPGNVDGQHFVSGIDYMPTMLEAAGLPLPPGMDGRSFLPVLQGQKQAERDHVVTCYNQTSARNLYPMRCVQTPQFGYIYNAWSDGQTIYKAESLSGLTFKAMQHAADGKPQIAERVKMLQYRVPEEFYDFQKDPNALHNLIDDPAYREPIAKLRGILERMMVESGDPLLDNFRHRDAKPAQRPALPKELGEGQKEKKNKARKKNSG